jgi:hypothetical protein
MVLKQQRDIKKQTGAELRRKTLYNELRKVSEVDASIVDGFAGELHRSMKANANPGYIVDLISMFSEAEKAKLKVKRDTMANERKQRSENKRKAVSYPYYQNKMVKEQMSRLRKWANARNHLASFVAQGCTDGLIISPDGIDLSSGGNARVLLKATMVHMYCSLRLLGKSRDDATEIVGTSMPPAVRMSAPSTIKRYLHEYFELRGFRETGNGRYIRENIFHNAALMYAMKDWLKRNEYKVLQSKDDPEDRKYFVAQHAADYLNQLLDVHPRLRVDKKCTASLPIKVGVMRIWLRKYLGREWKVRLLHDDLLNYIWK